MRFLFSRIQAAFRVSRF